MICEELSGAHKCSVCGQFFHAICGSYRENSEGFGLKVIRNLCVRNNRIKIEREGEKSGQEQQAQKTVSLSNWRLPAVDSGTNVVVRVRDIHQGRLDPRNILAVVADVNSSGLYLLGTKEGLFERMHVSTNSQLLITSLGHMMCPQVHYLSGQPQWYRLEESRDL